MRKFKIITIILFNSLLSFSEEVTFNTIEAVHNESIDKALLSLKNPLIIMLSILTVIQIMKVCQKSIFDNTMLSSLIPNLINIFLSFSVYVYIILNSKNIIDTLFGLFTGIGSVFTGKKIDSADSIWNTGLETTTNLWNMINDWQLHIKENPMEVMFDLNNYLNDMIKVISIIFVIFFIYLVYAVLIAFFLFISVQFKLGLSLTLPFVAGSTNDLTKEYMGHKFITVMMLGGFQLTITMLLTGMFNEGMEKAKFNQEMTIRELKLENIYLFLCVGIIIALVIFKINKLTSKVTS